MNAISLIALSQLVDSGLGKNEDDLQLQAAYLKRHQTSIFIHANVRLRDRGSGRSVLNYATFEVDMDCEMMASIHRPKHLKTLLDKLDHRAMITDYFASHPQQELEEILTTGCRIRTVSARKTVDAVCLQTAIDLAIGFWSQEDT